MQIGLISHKLNENDTTEKTQALVIYIQPTSNQKAVSKEKLTDSNTEKKIPPFYREPIFKAKKYDFL